MKTFFQKIQIVEENFGTDKDKDAPKTPEVKLGFEIGSAKSNIKKLQTLMDDIEDSFDVQFIGLYSTDDVLNATIKSPKELDTSKYNNGLWIFKGDTKFGEIRIGLEIPVRRNALKKNLADNNLSWPTFYTYVDTGRGWNKDASVEAKKRPLILFFSKYLD